MANTIKIKRRTDASDNSALAALSVGELGVDLTDSNKLYVGSSSGNQLLNPTASTNADTVDSLHASSFLRSDASDSFNCNGNLLSFDFDGERNSIDFTKNGNTRFVFWHTNSGNDLDIQRGTNNSGGKLKYAGNEVFTVAGGTLTGNLNANGLEAGVWSGNATYTGIFHSAQTGAEYCLISNDGNTFLSASTGYGVKIRGGNNVSTYEIEVYHNQLPTAGGNTILTTASGLQLSGGTLTGDLKIDRTSNTTSPVLQIENDADHVLQLGVVRSAAGTGPNTGIVNYPTAGLRIIKGTGTDERARFDTDGALLINTTSKGANSGKFFVGSPLATGSAAIAQFNGLLRTSYIITHSTSTGASDHAGLQPSTNNKGNVGNTAFRYYGGYFNVGSFSNSLLVNDSSNGGFGKIVNRQAAHTNADGIATVSAVAQGSNSLRLWVDSSGNRKINAGSTEVISFTHAAINLLQTVTASGTGHLFGKLNVGSVNNSFDFYNNGTSYFNGAVTVDDNLAVSDRLTVSDTSGADGLVIAGGENTGISARLFFETGTSGQGTSILNVGGGFQFRTGATAGSSSGAERMHLSSGGTLYPQSNGQDLGTTSKRWELKATSGDFSGGLTVSGTANFGGSYTNFGGGYGATGVSISSAGNIEANGYLTVDGVTNVTDLRIGYTRTNSHTSTNAAWYNIAGWGSSSGTRGGKIFVLSYTGGSWTPVTYVIKAFKNWSGTASLILEKHGNSNYITKVRIAHDGSASPGPVYKLQVYLINNSAGHNFRLYEYNAIGYNGGVASESMTAVSGSWTTITERDFPTSQSGITTTDLLVNNRIYSDGAIRVGTSTFTDYKASQQYSNGTYEMAISGSGTHLNVADGSNSAAFRVTPSSKRSYFFIPASESLTDYGGLTIQEPTNSRGLSMGYDHSAGYFWMYARDVGVGSKGINLNNTLYVKSGNNNVGIGVATPLSSAGIARFLQIGSANDNHSGIVFQNADTTKAEMWLDNGALHFWRKPSGSGDYWMTLKNNGDVDVNNGLIVGSNLTGTGTLGTNANRWSTIYGGGGDFNGVINTKSGGGSVKSVCIGGAGNGHMRVRHIEGKMSTNDGYGNLYLNHYNTTSNSRVFINANADGSGSGLSIRTYSTDKTLNVNGTASITSNLTVGGNLSVSGGNLTIPNSMAYRVGGGADTLVGSLGNASGVLSLKADGTRDVQVGSNSYPTSIFVEGSNGRVGIGTASPSRKLVVSGGSARMGIENSTEGVVLGLLSDDAGFLQMNDGSGAAKVQLRSDAGNSYISGNGNFGIGTASPSAKLHVTGSAIFSGADTWAGNDTQTCAIYLNNTGRGLYGNFSNYARNLVKANSNYVEVGQNSTLVYGVKFIVGSNAANGFMFQSNIGGTMTTHMNIRGNTGRVGIGTTSPDYALDVRSSGATTLQVKSANNSDDTQLRLQSKNFFFNITNEGASGNITYISDDAQDQIWYTDNASNSSAERFRIKGGADTSDVVFSNSKVGIGIASPYAPLQVHNSADQAVVLSGATNPYIRWQSGSSNKAYIKWENSSSTFVIRNEAASKELRYNSTGLGIGCTPSYDLEVSGTISNFGDGKIIRLRSNDYIIGQIENKGTGANYDKGYFRLFDTGTAKVVLDSAGDSYFSGGSVGIGTASPSTNSKLTVNGGLAVGDATYQSNMNNGAADFSVDCNGTPQISWISNYLQVGGTGQNWSMRMYCSNTSHLQTYSSDLYITGGGTGTGYKLFLGTNGQTQTITCNNGSVGIGTATPSAKLDVRGALGANGTAVVTSYFVNTTSAATSSAIYIGASSGTDWKIGKNVTGIANNTNFSISDHANNRFVDINSSGHVGIGTINPSRELEITGSGNVYARITAATDNDSAALELNNNSNQLWTLKADDTSSDDFKITCNAGTALTIDGSTKDVTVGTSSSGLLNFYRLNQTATIGNILYATTFSRSGSGLSVPDIWDSGGNGIVIGHNSNTPMLKVTSTGVGINKTPAGYGDTKLEVNGNVSGTRFLSGGTITNGTHAFEAYGSSFESSSIRLKEQGSGENEDPGILFQKGNAASTGDHCGGIYFQGTSSLNYAIIRGTCAGSSKGQLNIHIGGQQNTITRTSNDTPIFQLGEGGLALGATPNDAYKLYVNGVSFFNGSSILNGILYFGSTSGSFITTSSSNLRLAGDNGVKLQTYSGGWQDRLVIADGGQITFANAYTFPTSIGSAGQVLKVPSSGTTLEWGSGGSGSGSGTVNENHAADTNHEVAVHLGGSTVGEAHKMIYNSGSGLTINTTSSETDSTYALYVAGGIKSSTGGLYVTGDGYISSRLGVATSVDTSYGIKVAGYIASYGHTTWSDYRLKDNANIWNTSEAATLVKDVPVYSYRWNDNCEAKSVQDQDRIGFLAHEVSERINKNNLVINEKDGEKYQSVNQTDMIPILWAALQDALKRIEELEAK